MSIHYVHVQPIGPGIFNLAHLIRKVAKVACEQAWGYNDSAIHGIRQTLRKRAPADSLKGPTTAMCILGVVKSLRARRLISHSVTFAKWESRISGLTTR